MLNLGQYVRLQWINIKGDLLYVKESVAQKLKGGDRKTPLKNKSSYRILQIPLPLKKILDEYHKRYERAERFIDNWHVCGGERCLRDTTIENRNILFSQTAELKHIRIHDFRHSHVSVLANEGINTQEIARRLGHKKIEITWNTYNHLYTREEEREVEILNRVKIVDR